MLADRVFGTHRRATDAQVFEDAERLIGARNERRAKRMPMLFLAERRDAAVPNHAAPGAVLDRHANEYKSRSRRDDDGDDDDGDDGGGDDASNAVGQRDNSGDGGGDDDDGGNTARPVLRLASLPQQCARHPSSTHSVHRELAPEARDTCSVACFV
jgi:hypothetical protein